MRTEHGRLRIGIDTGGTFTDLALVDGQTGEAFYHKVSSTNTDPSRAIVDGFVELLTLSGHAVDDVALLVHGTTVATNATLQQTYPRTGLLTTRGFRDLLELARQRRPHLYDLDVAKPAPIAPRHLRLEATERIGRDGRIVRPLELLDVERAAAVFQEAGVEAVAVVFLHSYANPVHEQAAVELLRRLLPGVRASASSDVNAEFREFERTATTVLNAALSPVIDSYVGNLERDLPVPIRIMQSNGGIMTATAARERPINTLLSGPAAGVVGALAAASAAEVTGIITFDMGGTSTDVCLVQGAEPRTRHETTVGGFPIRVATLDIHSIGAGGGSIAWVDAGGFLKVGPQSAGAQPGPACYARGGSVPTVTDANVVMRRLNPHVLLGGRMAIREDLAASAVGSLEWPRVDGRRPSLNSAAAGTIRIVNSNIAQAIRFVSVERGFDPREFTLVAFGGAGPLHAVEVARELGMERILVPARPGIVCALGLLYSDVRADFARTRLVRVDKGCEGIVIETLAEMEQLARNWAHREGTGETLLARTLAMRYVGQTHELPIEVADEDRLTAGNLMASFHARHSGVYGYAADEESVEIVTFRVTVVGVTSKPAVQPLPRRIDDSLPNVRERREVAWEERYVETSVFERAALMAGDRLDGPAIIEQMDATTFVPPGARVEVDRVGNLLINAGRS